MVNIKFATATHWATYCTLFIKITHCLHSPPTLFSHIESWWTPAVVKFVQVPKVDAQNATHANITCLITWLRSGAVLCCREWRSAQIYKFFYLRSIALTHLVPLVPAQPFRPPDNLQVYCAWASSLCYTDIMLRKCFACA